MQRWGFAIYFLCIPCFAGGMQCTDFTPDAQIPIRAPRFEMPFRTRTTKGALASLASWMDQLPRELGPSPVQLLQEIDLRISQVSGLITQSIRELIRSGFDDAHQENLKKIISDLHVLASLLKRMPLANQSTPKKQIRNLLPLEEMMRFLLSPEAAPNGDFLTSDDWTALTNFAAGAGVVVPTGFVPGAAERWAKVREPRPKNESRFDKEDYSLGVALLMDEMKSELFLSLVNREASQKKTKIREVMEDLMLVDAKGETKLNPKFAEFILEKPGLFFSGTATEEEKIKNAVLIDELLIRLRFGLSELRAKVFPLANGADEFIDRLFSDWDRSTLQFSSSVLSVEDLQSDAQIQNLEYDVRKESLEGINDADAEIVLRRANVQVSAERFKEMELFLESWADSEKTLGRWTKMILEDLDEIKRGEMPVPRPKGNQIFFDRARDVSRHLDQISIQYHNLQSFDFHPNLLRTRLYLTAMGYIFTHLPGEIQVCDLLSRKEWTRLLDIAMQFGVLIPRTYRVRIEATTLR